MKVLLFTSKKSLIMFETITKKEVLDYSDSHYLKEDLVLMIAPEIEFRERIDNIGYSEEGKDRNG